MKIFFSDRYTISFSLLFIAGCYIRSVLDAVLSSHKKGVWVPIKLPAEDGNLKKAGFWNEREGQSMFESTAFQKGDQKKMPKTSYKGASPVIKRK